MKQTAYVYYRCYEWQDPAATGLTEVQVVLNPPNYDKENMTLMGMFAFDVPEFSIPTVQQVNENRIEHLRAAREKILADAFIEAKNLEERIQKLLALPQAPQSPVYEQDYAVAAMPVPKGYEEEL
jgi:hypothetical protein